MVEHTESPEDWLGGIGGRELHFIWIIDCSGGMAGTKMDSANRIVRQLIHPVREVADDNNAKIMARAITISDGARWHVGQPTEVHDFEWEQDVVAGGPADMGQALRMVAEALKRENMPKRGYRPVLVLVSGSRPTDDLEAGMKALMDQPWGAKAIRLAIAIEQGSDEDALGEFVSDSCPVLAEGEADQLLRYMFISGPSLTSSPDMPKPDDGSEDDDWGDDDVF